MSINFLSRSLWQSLSRLPRRLLFRSQPKVTPLTFRELNRQRRESLGTDQTPCQCPVCRRGRM